jgi:chemotaxis protein CheZ
MSSAAVPFTRPARRSSRAEDRKPETDLKAIARELAAVASYIAHLKSEIGALKVTELTGDRLPMANQELGRVVNATASATNAIMSAAEDLLALEAPTQEAYRQEVEARALAILEACSFQDLTGQRIAKVVEALGQLEKRLERFASAVQVRESETTDPEEASRQARKDALLLNGPQGEGEGVLQDEIDKLFA